MCCMKVCYFPLCSKIVLSLSCHQFLYCWTDVSQMSLSLLFLWKTFSSPLNVTSCCPAECLCDSTKTNFVQIMLIWLELAFFVTIFFTKMCKAHHICDQKLKKNSSPNIFFPLWLFCPCIIDYQLPMFF